MTTVLNDIAGERKRQIELAYGGDTEVFDRSNARNDWIAYITAYLGRATANCQRNEREDQDFRANLLKAAALCVAAIEAHDKGYC